MANKVEIPCPVYGGTCPRTCRHYSANLRNIVNLTWDINHSSGPSFHINVADVTSLLENPEATATQLSEDVPGSTEQQEELLHYLLQMARFSLTVRYDYFSSLGNCANTRF